MTTVLIYTYDESESKVGVTDAISTDVFFQHITSGNIVH